MFFRRDSQRFKKVHDTYKSVRFSQFLSIRPFFKIKSEIFGIFEKVQDLKVNVSFTKKVLILRRK